MAWNGKPAKTSTTDYTNLLYTDSDSDRVPDLKLPPVKGKKQKRKKGLPSRQDEATCSTWSVLKVILGIVILAAVTALAIISFWSLQRISDLQDKISELQSMDSTSPDIINIQSQLAAFNRTVDSLKTGDGGIKTILEDIAVIKEELKTLEESTKKLEPAISASENLLSVPEKLESLTKTVASMGSDLSGLMTKNSDIVSKSEEIRTRLTALETQVEGSSSSAPVKADVDNQLGSMLQEQVANLKLSISSEVTRINKSLDQQETRISLLENFTSKNVKPDLDADAIHNMISLAVEEKLDNMTSEVSPSEGGQRLSQGQLVELQNQMDSIMEEVTQIQQTSDAQVDKSTFMVLKEDFISDFKDINASLLALTSDVDVMASRLDLVDQTLVNITNVIHAVITKESLVASVEPKLTGDKTTKQDHESPDIETTTSTSITSTSTVDTATATNGVAHRERNNISIPGISSLKDLQEVFATVWPVTEGEEVNLDSLNKFLGNKALDVDAMKQYDRDNNGYYSLEEMAMALGLKNRTKR